MNTFWTKIKTLIKDNWLTIILGVVIFILATTMMQQCQNMKDQKTISDHNVSALTDSILYYKGKNGELIAEKKILCGDKETLKLAYDSLYKKMQSMSVKDPSTIVDVNAEINNGKKDTTYIIETTCDSLNVEKDFNFDNKWRKLNGTIKFNDNTLGLNIKEDKVNANVTIAIEGGTAYVRSDNPYLNINDIKGVTVPQYKPMWSLTVGPSVSLGYDPIHNRLSPTVGVSLVVGYTIWSGGKKADVKK